MIGENFGFLPGIVLLYAKTIYFAVEKKRERFALYDDNVKNKLLSGIILLQAKNDVFAN